MTPLFQNAVSLLNPGPGRSETDIAQGFPLQAWNQQLDREYWAQEAERNKMNMMGVQEGAMPAYPALPPEYVPEKSPMMSSEMWALMQDLMKPSQPSIPIPPPRPPGM